MFLSIFFYSVNQFIRETYHLIQ